MRLNLQYFLIFAILNGFVPGIAVQPVQASQLQLPESTYIVGLVGHAQSYSLSCESRSAADWAAYWGKPVSESEFLNRLPHSDNPDLGFVGDPNGYWGSTPPYAYGVHARPVAALLQEYGLNASARQGLSWDDLREEIAAGRPVIVWVIGQMWGGTAVDYTASDGEIIKVAAFEHTMILVGYDPNYVQVVDPSTGWAYHYQVGAFLQSWEVLGRMAVVWEDPPPPPPPPPTETPIPVPTATPAPTATLVALSYLNLAEPIVLYLPLVGQYAPVGRPAGTVEKLNENVVAAGVCLFRRGGILYLKPFTYLRGWCISALMIRPENIMGIVGPIPELP